MANRYPYQEVAVSWRRVRTVMEEALVLSADLRHLPIAIYDDEHDGRLIAVIPAERDK